MNENEMLDTVRRINSLVSSSMGLGDSSSDPFENIDVREKIIYGAQARLLRRSLDVLGRVINSPIEDALKGEFTVKTNYDDYGVGKLIKERLEQLDINKALYDIAVASDIYSRGGVLYPVLREDGSTRDRAHLNQSLRKDGIIQIEKLNVIPEDHFYFTVQNYDALARGFGEIDRLYVDGRYIHSSRHLHLINDLDIYTLRGSPLIDRVLVACKALAMAEWTIANLITRYRALVVKYPAQKEATANKTTWFNLQQIIDDIKMKFTSKSVAAVPTGYDFEYLQTTFTGLNEATNFLYEYLSTVRRIPQSVIRGSAQGELASSTEDKRSYHAMIESEIRGKKFRRTILFISELSLYERNSELNSVLLDYGIRPGDVTLQVEFEPLQTSSPLEVAQINLLNTQRAALEIDKQISSPLQAQSELYPERETYIGGEPVDSDPFDIGDLLSTLQENDCGAKKKFSRS